MIPSTDVIQLSLTVKMTTAQVVETSVTVNNKSPIQDYVHPDDQSQPFEIITIVIIVILIVMMIINILFDTSVWNN